MIRIAKYLMLFCLCFCVIGPAFAGAYYIDTGTWVVGGPYVGGNVTIRFRRTSNGAVVKTRTIPQPPFAAILDVDQDGNPDIVYDYWSTNLQFDSYNKHYWVFDRYTGWTIGKFRAQKAGLAIMAWSNVTNSARLFFPSSGTYGTSRILPRMDYLYWPATVGTPWWVDSYPERAYIQNGGDHVFVDLEYRTPKHPTSGWSGNNFYPLGLYRIDFTTGFQGWVR